MPTIRTCANCGTPLNCDTLDGFCPACTFEGALRIAGGDSPEGPAGANPAPLLLHGASGTAADASCPSGPDFSPRNSDFARVLGDYELLEEIGRGGMGVVYRARQVKLDRIVAVKLVLMGVHADDLSLRRFRSEAAAAAKLNHPNIVAIHEVGEARGQHFFSMDYVRGRNLEEYAREHPFTGRQAAQLMRTIAQAIHYAHEHGIVHRDLKPSNILIDLAVEPHITDFGLAKQLAGAQPATVHPELTLSGQVLGSPSFLPPEQASGRRGKVGPHTDVYALGAILYYLLTRRPPFAGETVTDTLQGVLNEEPVSPRVLNRSVPRDLETICLKCLEKETTRRYASARLFADELDRFLASEPIRARPIPAVVRLGRWCRRKPAVATALGLGLALAIGSPIVALHIAHERDLARHSVTLLEIQQAEQRFSAGDASTALAYLARILRREPDNRVVAERMLWALSYRNFCLPVLALRHSAPVLDAKHSPDGKFVITGSEDGTARLWSTATGAETSAPLRHRAPVGTVRFSPDGTMAATGSADRTARLWDVASGLPLTPPLEHGGTVVSLDFSSDGKWLATAAEDGAARIWDTRSGVVVAGPMTHSNGVSFVSFSPDGAWLLGVCSKQVVFWNTQTGVRRETWFGDGNRVTRAAFTKDGTRVLTAGFGGMPILWDFRRGYRIWSAASLKACLAAAISADGAKLICGGAASYARVWHLESGEPLTPELAHEAAVTLASFSPDGRVALTASRDNTVRIWDPATGHRVTEPLVHDGSIRVAEFSPDSRRLLTVSEGNHALLWEIRSCQPLALRLPHSFGVSLARFSPDGLSTLTVDWGKIPRIWDARAGDLRTNIVRPSDFYIPSVEMSPDSRRFVFSTHDGTAQVWDLRTARQVCPPLLHSPGKGSVVASRFDPDGARIATASHDGTAKVWDGMGGALLLTLSHKGKVNSVEFSPDGTVVLTASEDGTAGTWNSRSGERLLQLHHEGAVAQARFSPDGRRIATASEDKTARVWRARRGTPLCEPLLHRDEVRSVSFSPDARRLLTVCGNAAYLWNLLEKHNPGPLALVHGGGVQSAAFSPDGLRVITASLDGTVRVWDAESGHALSEPIPHGVPLNHAEFSPDNTWVVTAPGNPSDGQQAAKIIEVPRAVRPVPAWLPDLAEAMAGQRLDRGNSRVAVPPDTILRLRERLASEVEPAYASWSKWFFGGYWSRQTSPASQLTTEKYIQRCIEENSAASLQSALLLSPTNSAAIRRFLNLAFRTGEFADPATLAWAEWHLRRGLFENSNTPEVLATRSALLTVLARRDALTRPVPGASGAGDQSQPVGASELHVPQQYPTIQIAVDAARSGDTIRIAAGDYYEQVVITNKTLILIGEPPGTTLHAFSGMQQTLLEYGDRFTARPVVTLRHEANVVLSGLTLDGERRGGEYSTAIAGIFFLCAEGTVTNCTIRGFRKRFLQKTPYGFGLIVRNPGAIGCKAANVHVLDSTFEDNLFGLAFFGDPLENAQLSRVTAVVRGNTITGLGPSPVAINYGIWIGSGVSADVSGNVLSDHIYTGSELNFASAINAYDALALYSKTPFVPLQSLRLTGNIFSNNSGGIVLVGANNSEIVSNSFLGHAPGIPGWGALAVSGTNCVVAANSFSDLQAGILLLGRQSFGVGWPETNPAANPNLMGNRFYAVHEPIRIGSPVIGAKEQDTRVLSANEASKSLTRLRWEMDATETKGLEGP